MTGLLLLPGDTHTVQAEVNWGRHICRCPVCPSALALNPGTPAFQCWDCGARAQVIWPDDDMIAGVERLLSMRPNVATRNWQPGETLIDLMMENGQHGVFDRMSTALPETSLLQVDEGRIVNDALPALPSRIDRRAVEA